MNEQIKIKTKIFKLLQKAASDGCTESEAMIFAEKAGELMDQFSLSITDIQILQTECVQRDYKMSNSKCGVVGQMAVAVARYCDTRVWVTQGTRHGPGNTVVPAVLHFFGLESDVETAMFLLEIVEKAMTRELNLFKDTPWWKAEVVQTKMVKSRSASSGFTNGFSNRMCARVNDMKDERDDKLAQEQADLYNTLKPEHRERTARNLVAVKVNHVETEFKKLGMRLSGGGRSQRGGDWDARSRGKQAANNVSLNAGVSGQRKTLMIS